MNRDLLASELEDIALVLRDSDVAEVWMLPDELRAIARQIEVATASAIVVNLSDYRQ